ncbi:MAG TPA: hypothetical protein VKB34_12680 [Povalibacter sp.]|nr:hypothetical protein [Povalibacter sp.]
MDIYRFQIGQHLKVHSFNSTDPRQRAHPAPPALMLICHGLYTNSSGTVRVPDSPQVRFATEHGKPNDNIDHKYFRELIQCGLGSALQYDFKVTAGGNPVCNYFLGKGEPDMTKGATARARLSYDKAERMKHPTEFNAKRIGKVRVLSSAYVENLLKLAEELEKEKTAKEAQERQRQRQLARMMRDSDSDNEDKEEAAPPRAPGESLTDTFDFATVRASCQTLSDVFASIATVPAPNYDYLLCAFCREFSD